jgi:hypothetical protein
LHNVLAIRIREFGPGPALEQLDIELVHVVLHIPVRHVLVQPVQPVRRSRHVPHLLLCNNLRHEIRNRVADEDIALLDVRPDPVPHASGRRTLLVRKVGAHLNVAAVDDRPLGVVLLGDVNEFGHLRVVDDYYVCAAEGSGPIAVGILLAPFVEDADLVGLEGFAGGFDTLEDVVVVLGDAEDFGLGAGDVPVDVLVTQCML